MKKLALCGILFVNAATASAQTWPDKNAATPNLVQTGFGPNGAFLPFDGGSYCGPTTASMALGYLNNAGFTQLIGSSPTEADYTNLVRVLSGLAQSSDSGGTDTGPLLSAIGTYMSAKGISAANRVVPSDSSGYAATIGDIQAQNVGQQILFGILGWYYNDNGTYIRNGGHFVAITDQALGSPGSLTVHNPFPNAFLDVPNTPSNVQQTIPMANFIATSTNNNYPLPPGTYLQFAPGQQNIGPTAGTQAILEQVFAISIDASQLPGGGFVPQDWAITGSTVLNTGGGNLDVTTKVTGSGGIRKVNDGDLVFLKAVTLSGNHSVEGGTMVSRVQSGDALGTGSITLLETGGLELRPDDAQPAAVSLTVASRANTPTENGARVTFSGGNSLTLDRGINPSLTVTLGGNDGNGISNLSATSPGATLVVRANDLGGTEKLLVTGSGGNLPVVTNGMVDAHIVGASGSSRDGAFLTYDAGSGFTHAATVQGDINNTTASSIYKATTDQTLTGNVSTYALTVEESTINGASVLTVGAGSGPTGVILNGGTIATGSLAFGGANAAVYTNTAGGTINAGLTGTGSFVKFGPGRLDVIGDASALTGPAQVQTGILAVANTWGASSTSVLANAQLQINTGGSVSGNITVGADATLALNGGKVQNVAIQSTTNASGPVQGGTLEGAGTVQGDVFLNGYIAADPASKVGTLTIEGLVKVEGTGAAFIWSLPSLVDNTTGVAGTNWNAIELTNASATFGSESTDSIALLLDFGAGLDPNSGNPFWAVDHKWTILTFSGVSSAERLADLYFPTTAFPAGNFAYHYESNQTVLIYTAVPEPSTPALLLLTTAGFAVFLWCKKRKATSTT